MFAIDPCGTLGPMSRSIQGLLAFGLVLILLPVVVTGGIASPASALNSKHLPVSGVIEQFDLSGIWHATDNEGIILIREASQILEQLQARSPCAVEAAIALSHGCANLTEGLDQRKESIEDAENLKVLYSIRTSLCQTAYGGAKVPSSCKAIMPLDGARLNLADRVNQDVKISRSTQMPRCVEALQKTYFHWTSYSNAFQDSTTICGASRVDVELRQSLESYKTMFQNLVDYVSYMHFLRDRSKAWQSDAEQRAQEANAIHLDRMAEIGLVSERLYQQMTEQVRNLLRNAALAQDALIADISRSTMIAMNDSFQAVDILNCGFENLEINIARLFGEISKEFELIQDSQLQTMSSLNAVISDGLDAANDINEKLSGSTTAVRETTQLVNGLGISVEQLNDRMLEAVEHSDGLKTVVEFSKGIHTLTSMLHVFALRSTEAQITVCVVSSALLLLMIPGKRKSGAKLLLSFAFIQSARRLLLKINVADFLKQDAGRIETFSHLQVVIAFVACICLSISIIWLATSLCRHLGERRLRKEYYQAFEHGLIARGMKRGPRAYYHATAFTDSAESSPPGY